MSRGVRAGTTNVNRELLRELGFELGTRAAGGESQGAWFATAPDGTPVVLKWIPGETVADRYAVLLPALDELRARGVPVPEYPQVFAVNGWTLSAQRVLPGRSQDNPSPAVIENDGRARGRQSRHRWAAADARPAPVARSSSAR